MRLKEEEEKDLTLVKAFVTPIWRYVVAVADRGRPIADHVIGEEVVSLLSSSSPCSRRATAALYATRAWRACSAGLDPLRQRYAPRGLLQALRGRARNLHAARLPRGEAPRRHLRRPRAPYARTYESTHPLNPWSEVAGKEQGLAAAVKEAAAAAREELKGGCRRSRSSSTSRCSASARAMRSRKRT